MNEDFPYRHAPVRKQTIVASVHSDVFDAMEQLRAKLKLTRSGVVHHLLRQALDLPTLPLPPNGNPN